MHMDIVLSSTGATKDAGVDLLIAPAEKEENPPGCFAGAGTGAEKENVEGGTGNAASPPALAKENPDAGAAAGDAKENFWVPLLPKDGKGFAFSISEEGTGAWACGASLAPAPKGIAAPPEGLAAPPKGVKEDIGGAGVALACGASLAAVAPALPKPSDLPGALAESVEKSPGLACGVSIPASATAQGSSVEPSNTSASEEGLLTATAGKDSGTQAAAVPAEKTPAGC
mmetsp:Transcript_91991/g.210674  ORF Transcript_91991/g.210674 Transcript_91991/m.210674 type:complete len:228 (+) Transcript_91991:183-866(+)